MVTTDPAKVIKGTEIDNEYNAIANAIASKADTNSPALTGTPTAPTATVGSNTTQVANTAFVQSGITSALSLALPSGVILLWSGSIATIPSGWVLCNGSNSTPDLRNRFVVGAGSAYAVGATGGSANAIAVSHSHAITDPGHYHAYQTFDAINVGAPEPSSGGLVANRVYANTGTTATGITINSAGSDGTNANLPPYYALAYIMKS